MAKVVLGLVGYYQFIRGYPLGPEMKERLESRTWQQSVDIKEMNWGPVAIVQDFQANSTIYDRVVLVAAVDRGGETGSITARRWAGGELSVMDVQDRVFEAVTGVISVDNLLVIGQHFKIWPKEVIIIEVQMPDNCIGEMVLKELEMNQQSGETTIIGEQPITPDIEKVVDRIVSLTQTAVEQGVQAMPNLIPLSADDLNPLSKICHNRLIDDCRLSTPIN